jgi:alkanesulfonate monooxygenase SsuD/methylene tetrahydromethanopterin reductase-like flavin-dependent oxidoreductase (luciferase family)
MNGGHAVKVGILLPTREAAILGQYSVRPLLDLAQQVEDLGFDSVWAGDSLLARPRLDPLIVLSACAAVTHRVVLGTAALTAALRPPLIGANMLTSLDHAAPGRLRVGVGAGFPVPETEHEFSAVGVPFARRSARLDETVRLWKQVWTCGSGASPVTAFHGAIWDLEGLDRLPGPATPDGPGIWLAAGATPPVLDRAAALYDGWLPFLPDPEEYRRAWSRITHLAEDAGRAAGAIEPGLYATVHLDADRARAEARLEEYVQGYYGRSLEFMSAIQAYRHGSAEQCARWLARFVDAGARHLVLRVGALDPGRQIELIAAELLPALRAIPAAVSPRSVHLDHAGSPHA